MNHKKMPTELDIANIRRNAVVRVVARILRIASIFIFVGAWFSTEMRIIIGNVMLSVGIFGITTILMDRYE